VEGRLGQFEFVELDDGLFGKEKTWQYLGESGDIQSVIQRADTAWRLPIAVIFICVKLRPNQLCNENTFILIHGISRTAKKKKDRSRSKDIKSKLP
jgi:hypothetical protein